MFTEVFDLHEIPLQDSPFWQLLTFQMKSQVLRVKESCNIFNRAPLNKYANFLGTNGTLKGFFFQLNMLK